MVSPVQKSTGSFTISDREFDKFRRLIYQETGIHLVDGKKLLLVNRLSKRLKDLGFNNFSDYYAFIYGNGRNSAEIKELINRVTTNKTDFFREAHHFDYLKDRIFPRMIEEDRRNIRIWSAGCSTGEEAYTIAMITKEAFEHDYFRDIKILATDLDTNVLAVAKKGIYSPTNVGKIPEYYLDKYLKKMPDGNYSFKQNIRDFLDFKQLNLMRPQLPFKKGFNLVFCRNVLIYFSKEERNRLLERIHRVIREKGYLILGHSESLIAENLGFRSLTNTIYRKQ